MVELLSEGRGYLISNIDKNGTSTFFFPPEKEVHETQTFPFKNSLLSPLHIDEIQRVGRGGGWGCPPPSPG